MGIKVFVKGYDTEDALRLLRTRLRIEKQYPGTLPRWYKKDKSGRYLKPSHRRRRRWLADQATKRGVPVDAQGHIPKYMSKRRRFCHRAGRNGR